MHWIGWMPNGEDRPLLILNTPLDEQPATIGNGSMIALAAATRAAVRDGHALALQNGGTDEGAPGLRPHYHPDYYGAYVRDPEGNKLCLCCHDPEDET